MNVLHLLHIRQGSIGRHQMGNEMGKIFISRLGKMHLVAKPGEVALVTVMSLMIIGRTNGEMCRRQIIFVAQVDGSIFVEEWLHPATPQPIYLWKLAQVGGSRLAPDLKEQTRAILPNLFHHLLLFVFSSWKTPFFDALGVAFKPTERNPLFEPVRSFFGHGVERSPQRLPNQLESIEPSNGCQHMCGVSSLHASFFDPPTLAQLLK